MQTSNLVARARLAIQAAVRQFIFDPNVSLIDFGFPVRKGVMREEREALSIRFHVYRKWRPEELERAVAIGQTNAIPPIVSEIRTDVLETSEHHQLLGVRPQISSANLPRAQRRNPLQGGISISNARQNTYGTLGGLVVDRVTEEPMILSNWHVLAGDWGALPGQAIYQPGRRDQGTPRDTVATLTRHAMNVSLDAAVARLNGVRPLDNDQFDLGAVRGLAAPYLGQNVIKSGRQTELTEGFVTGIEGVKHMRYAGVERLIRQVVTIDPLDAFSHVSSGGDSGSLWLDTDTREAVALHFAGSNQPERAWALNLEPVLDALQVSLVVGTG